MSRRAKIALLVVPAILAGLFLMRVRGVLTPFYLALGIAYLSNPLVNTLEAKEVPRPIAILLVYAMFAIFLTLLVYAVLPSFVKELDQLVAFLPEQTRRLEGLTEGAVSGLKRVWMPETMEEIVDVALGRAERLLEQFASRMAGILVGMLSQLVNLALAPFLAYYLLRDVDLIARVSVSWMPSGMRKDATELAHRVNRVVGGFLRGQLVVSTAVGIAIAAGLSLLGVRYALVVGLFAGLADIIPYFGPIISAVPAVALALVQSPLTAVWVVVLLVAVQQLEGSLLSPKIVGEQVGLHPLTVIFSVLAGGEIGGVLGMFVAVPVAATLKVIAAYIGEKVLES